MKGKGVSSGVGIGKVKILESKNVNNIENEKFESIEVETKKFKNAISLVIKDIEELVEKLTGTEKEIMEAYLMLLKDPMLENETIEAIKCQKCSASKGTEIGFNKVIEILKNVDNEYISERSKDIVDMKEKVIQKLLNIKTINISKLPQNTIIVAKELTTSDTAKLDFKNVAGIITEAGGINSHTSIIARTHEIPAVVGVANLLNNIKDDDLVAVNGDTGEIIVNPSAEEFTKLESLEVAISKEKEELEKYKNRETKTQDGKLIKILANIGTTNDVDSVISNSAEGVGLFRTEFLYMDSNKMPTEEEQFEAYKTVAESLNGKRAVIRTLDIGGDKHLKYMNLPEEQNPFLGYRAIRICLENTKIFKTQIRAILRAGKFGNLAIMLPMISSIEELREAKKIIEETKNELKNEKIEFNSNLQVGIMIEIPSAVLIAEELGKECDFFSIGTNDLIQYTVAVERGNEKVEKLYSKYHPAVIKLIKMAIDGAHKNNIHCGMCGEAAGKTSYIPLLVGLGLDDFSMNSNMILKSRRQISTLCYEDCKKIAEQVLKMASAKEVEQFLKKDLFLSET